MKKNEEAAELGNGGSDHLAQILVVDADLSDFKDKSGDLQAQFYRMSGCVDK